MGGRRVERLDGACHHGHTLNCRLAFDVPYPLKNVSKYASKCAAPKYPSKRLQGQKNGGCQHSFAHASTFHGIAVHCIITGFFTNLGITP